MTTTIALAGKGGVGKTTIAGMVIKYLIQNRSGAVLAIDADPSANLNMVLGLDLEWTVGDIREGLLDQVQSSLTTSGAAMGSLPGGMSKRDYLDYRDTLSFDQLCASLGDLFIDFVTLFCHGEGVRIIDRMDALRISVFS